MLKAYEYRLYPTDTQKVLLAKHFGCARWVYNYGLALKTKTYAETKKAPSCVDLANTLPALKKTKETEWLGEVDSQSLQQSLRCLDNAYTRFFKKQGGFPKFKSKSNRQSYRLPQRISVDFDSGKLHIPKFKEGIKTVFHRKFDGKIKNATIKKTCSDKYFVSILVEDEKKEPKIKTPKLERILGLDMGIKNFLTDSEGNKVENPRFYAKEEKRIKKAQKRLSKKIKGSKNRNKARIKLARIFDKVTNRRKDFLHKLSRKLVENQDYDGFAMEDLSVKSLMQKSKQSMSKNIGDASWSMFKRMMEYKCKESGKNVVLCGRFEPSSRLCKCGEINRELKLSDRVWTCKHCGKTHDRDILAAQNIRDFALREPSYDKKVKIISKDKSLVKIGADCSKFTSRDIEKGFCRETKSNLVVELETSKVSEKCVNILAQRSPLL